MNTQYRPLTSPDMPMQTNAALPNRGQGSGAQKRKAALGGVKKAIEGGVRSIQRLKDGWCDAVNELCYTPRGTREERTQKREQLKALEDCQNPMPSGSGACARAHHLSCRV